MFTYSLKEHLLVNLIMKECSQWVLGMQIKLHFQISFTYKFFLLFCCLFYNSCPPNPQLLSFQGVEV